MLRIYDTFRLLWNNSGMKFAALVAVFSVSMLAAQARAGMQAPPSRGQRPAPLTTASPEKVADAYAQFLLGHRFEENEDETSAIAAYKRAMELDPMAAEIPAQLAGLYLKASKVQEAMATAQVALKIAPANREANRVLGMVYAALSEGSQDATPRGRSADKAAEDNLAKAVKCFELSLDGALAESDPNVRATLARLYLRAGSFDKAIPLLTDLVNEEAGWQDGPLMLVEAYAGAGRSADAIAWLEERTPGDPRLLPALADFYERERRWPDAAAAYAKALQRAPRNLDLKARYASALMNAGGRDNVDKARTALVEVTSARTTDVRLLYLLSQAQRRLGEFKEAEASARRVIAQSSKSPWGYYALAESLEARRQYQSVVDEIAPVVAANRGKAADGFDVGLLLPHLGFAYQETGQYDKAIATFDEARKLSPDDPAIAGYLIEADIAGKKYGAAVDAAKSALGQYPNDLRLTRLEAQALRHSGKADQGIALLAEAVTHHADDPLAYVSLAQAYSDAEQGPQAVKVLQDAQAKFPKDDGIAFELGTVLDKQKKFADAESAFRSVLTRDPDNATALNYIGYMLAERGERLDESVTYLKHALVLEPENASFLDSLGWAYFKADKLDLAEANLRRAADQLKTNSVIQEHFGQVLFKLGRYDEAIAAWTLALSGDGDSIDKADVDKKIRAAKQKLPKK
jgi:tetratricopeptide (TPR) repeat protein